MTKKVFKAIQTLHKKHHLSCGQVFKDIGIVNNEGCETCPIRKQFDNFGVDRYARVSCNSPDIDRLYKKIKKEIFREIEKL